MLAADQDIIREGDPRPTECWLVLSGLVCCYKTPSQGQRKILSFHIPGDIPDLQSIYLTTLAPSQPAFIPHYSLHSLIRAHSGVAEALWRDSLINAAIFREWMVGLGRRTAVQRIACLL